MKLTEFQKARGMKNTELAQALGITPVTLSRYKSSKPKIKRIPKSDILDKIRKLSGGLVDYDDFIAESPPSIQGKESVG